MAVTVHTWSYGLIGGYEGSRLRFPLLGGVGMERPMGNMRMDEWDIT